MFDIKRARSTKPIVIAILLVILALSGCIGPRGWPGVVVDVDGDTVFVGSMNGSLFRLEVSARLEDKDGDRLSKADGEWVWEPEAEPAGSIFSCGQAGQFSSGALYGPPALGNNTVYTGAYTGKVYAITQYGDNVWDEPFDTGGTITGGVAVANDTLFVGSSDGKLYAVDVNSGEAKRGFDPYPTGDKIVSTPVVKGGVVYFGSLDHKLYAIDADTGKLIWDQPFKTGGGIGSTPLIEQDVDGKDVLYFGSFDSKFYAVYADTSKPKWERPFEAGNWFWSQALYHNGIIYACSLDHNVYAIDAESGELTSGWSPNPFSTADQIRSSPVIVGDVLVVASEDGKVYGINLESGGERWQSDLESSILAPLYTAGNMVYINGRDDNTLYALDSEGDTKWSIPLSKVE